MSFNHKFKPQTIGVAAASLLSWMGIAAEPATGITLTDQNSVAQFHLDSTWGLYNWAVDGVDHIYQSWFWYRTGNDSQEYSINALTRTFLSQPDNDNFTAIYRGNGFEIEVQTTLEGQPRKQSNLFHNITIRNRSQSPLDFSLFMYADFDISQSFWDDLGQMAGVDGDTILQSDRHTTSRTMSGLSPSGYQIGSYPSILSMLLDSDIDNFDNAAASLRGDVTYGLQWDFALAGVTQNQEIDNPNPVAYLDIDMQIKSVPEPATFLGLGVVAGSLAMKRRRKVQKG